MSSTASASIILPVSARWMPVHPGPGHTVHAPAGRRIRYNDKSTATVCIRSTAILMRAIHHHAF